MYRTGVKIALGTAFLAIGAFEANAEEELRDTGVLNRARPDYDAPGVPAGGFTLFPSLTVAVGSDDNLFATEAFEVDDFFRKSQLRDDLAIKLEPSSIGV